MILKILKESIIESLDDFEQNIVDRCTEGLQHRANLKNPVYAEAYKKAYTGAVKAKKLRKQFRKTVWWFIFAVILFGLWAFTAFVVHKPNAAAPLGIVMLLGGIVCNIRDYRKLRKEHMETAREAVRKDTEDKVAAKKEAEKQAAAAAQAAKLAADKERAEKEKAARAAQKAAAAAAAPPPAPAAPPPPPPAPAAKPQNPKPTSSRPRLEGFRSPF